jgi:hypothetical protein
MFMIIKIGSTEGLEGRMKKHKAQFRKIFMMDVIPSGRFREFEIEIQKHQEVKPFYTPYVLKDGVVSNETFKVSQDKYLRIIRLAKRMEKNFLHTNRESKRPMSQRRFRL